MSNADPTRRSGEPADIPDDAPLSEDGFDPPETEAMDELEEETGLDLTDASGLDADNVPSDEENDRVFNAPD
jgi:hypothetical protein